MYWTSICIHMDCKSLTDSEPLINALSRKIKCVFSVKGKGKT